MPAVWSEAIVVESDWISPQVKLLKLAVKGIPSFQFIPGQFITLDLPTGQKRLDRWRSYSIASSPNHSNTFELCVVQLDGGKGSTYLCQQIRIGDSVNFKGPEGNFVLPENKESFQLVMICTGTGIAPFRSMIRQLYSHNSHQGKVHLIFGTRFEKDILYRNEFEILQKQYDSFRYDVCLSRESIAGFHYGYVHEIYQNTYGKSEDKTLFMLCGWSGMIDQSVEILQQNMRVSSKNIMYERFG